MATEIGAYRSHAQSSSASGRAAGAADVADVAASQAAVHTVIQRFGRVDCLVNAAGLTTRGSLTDTTPELFDQHVAVNLRGPFFLMQAVVNHLREHNRPGSIVNIITSSE
ncbi:MAG: SDR family NAD(P)-dependent oxidoreductase, partial [Actinophytocola sp.]|uniref:SDR family NAD(P)-dependent oxidoreductase n=1 Tax=Actinophytocola sp. TaxID=1872138 RepID=UPI003D6BDA1B